MKQKSISSLKKEAWTVFSAYIRQRDADDRGMVRCVTCGSLKFWKDGDAGHFLPGRGNAILFDERGVHFQCKPCNGGFRNQRFSKDEVAENYERYMLKRYGPKVVADLKRLRHTTKSFTIRKLETIIKKYQ